MKKYLFFALVAVPLWAHDVVNQMFRIYVSTKEQRTELANLGLAIEGVADKSVLVLGGEKERELIEKSGFKFESTDMDLADAFPSSDKEFHTYAQTIDELKNLAKQNPGWVSFISIGKSLEGRDLAGVRLSSNPTKDSLPTALFFGCHHAREHLSVEVPLKLALYLAKNYTSSPRVKKILDTTEIYIVPMVNPDGAEYDIEQGRYRMWRKNRRDNKNGTYGVDLNRNYGKAWGGEGSSGSTSSETYRGPAAFSEPETQAVRDFILARKKTTVLLTYHTFSELILWPFGFTYSQIPNTKDRTVFETMGKTMAKWNKYTPQKASELYLASGDTTDWAYDTRKIFAFTFELSPKSMFSGGFYPGAKAIEPTFKANLEPALYLMEKARNPYGVLAKK